MLIEMLYATYLLTIAIYAISVTICEIFIVEMCITLTLIFNMGQSEM